MTQSYVYVPYPSWRYHRTEKPRLVKNAADDAALGAEWAKTPAAFTAEPAPAVAPVTAPAAEPEPSPESQRAAELYASKAPEIVAHVKAATDIAALEFAMETEAKNPKGARKTVVQAIADRLRELVNG